MALNSFKWAYNDIMICIYIYHITLVVGVIIPFKFKTVKGHNCSHSKNESLHKISGAKESSKTHSSVPGLRLATPETNKG